MVTKPYGLLNSTAAAFLSLILTTRVLWLLVALTLVLFLSENSWSAISFIRSGGTTGTSFSMDIGSAATNRLIVVLADDESKGNSLSGVTVDGNSCTKVTEADNPDGAGNHQEMWYCDEDNLGSSSGSVTITIQGGNSGWAVHAHLYTGAGQSGPTDSGVDQTTVGGTTIMVNGIDVPANGLVLMGSAHGDGSPAVSSWTSPLTMRQDGPDPNSAYFADSSGIESSAQTNKTYEATFSTSFGRRATGIVAVWAESDDVTVSASGTQTSSLNIPSTNNYIGGTFVIKDLSGSRNVTGITITETGTVDAQSNLANVNMFYDVDTTSPYDCASETYGGSESQFGLTTSFNGANGTASFTGSVSISTVQTMCAYVVLDVGSGAADSETVEIEISNPSTDVIISSGSILTNTTFIRSGGFTGTSFSMDIGSAGTNRLVVVIAGDESDGNSLSGITVDGKNCTKVTEADNTSGPGNHQEMWYCDEDDLGSSSGSVTIAIQGGNGGWAVHGHLYTGVAQNGPVDSGIDQSSTSTDTITVTNIDVLANGLVIMGAGHGSSGTGISSWASPLSTRQNGPDPSSAELTDSSAFESSAQTNKTYIATFSGSFNRGTGIVATWAPQDSVALSGTTILRIPLNLGDFSDCKKITIDNTKVSGSSNHFNFPVLVSLTENYLKTTGNGGSVTDAEGDDIVFIDSDGSTQLDHEVEKYVATTGEYIPWVEVPTLKYNEDTVIYMYYGNSNIATSQENVAGVWDSNFKGVWHLHNDSLDSTANNNDGTNSGSTDAVGMIGDGQSFDGNNDYIDISFSGGDFDFTTSSSFTVEAWAKTSSSSRQTIIQRGYNTDGYYVMDFRNDSIRFQMRDTSGTRLRLQNFNNDSDDTWRHYVLVYEGSGKLLRGYRNGIQLGTDNDNGLSGNLYNNDETHPMAIGTRGDENRWYAGTLDEVRISSTNRSVDWILTEYNNQSSPATFYSVGACSGSATIQNWQESF